MTSDRSFDTDAHVHPRASRPRRPVAAAVGGGIALKRWRAGKAITPNNTL